jgi:hypothetical protein
MALDKRQSSDAYMMYEFKVGVQGWQRMCSLPLIDCFGPLCLEAEQGDREGTLRHFTLQRLRSSTCFAGAAQSCLLGGATAVSNPYCCILCSNTASGEALSEVGSPQLEALSLQTPRGGGSTAETPQPAQAGLLYELETGRPALLSVPGMLGV